MTTELARREDVAPSPIDEDQLAVIEAMLPAAIETYSRFRRCLDEFAATAGEDTKWDEAYAHFYALEQIIGTRMKQG